MPDLTPWCVLSRGRFGRGRPREAGAFQGISRGLAVAPFLLPAEGESGGRLDGRERRPVRRATAFVSLALAAAALGAPAPAVAAGLDLRLGAFLPRADSSLFHDDEELYLVDAKSDFTGFTGGIEYNVELGDYLELGFGVDGYWRSVDTSYREFINDDGTEIRQTLKLDIVPIGVTLRLVPTDRRARVAPYVGIGGDLFWWRYREIGDFIDFRDPTNPIVADSFVSDGWTPGFHVAGGLRFSVNYDFAVTAEARYQWGKEIMGDDFAPVEPGFENEIDLSGLNLTVGVHIRF